jgi:hypothetical protein
MWIRWIRIRIRIRNTGFIKDFCFTLRVEFSLLICPLTVPYVTDFLLPIRHHIRRIKILILAFISNLPYPMICFYT